MEASPVTKLEDEMGPEGPISKVDLPPEEEDKDAAATPAVEEPEAPQSEADEARANAEAELDKLQPLVEVVSYTIGKPPESGGEKNEYSIYVQQPLGYIATLRFYGLVGKTIAEAVKAGGVVDLGDAFNQAGGNIQERAKQIMEQSFNDAGSFAALLFQLVAYSPDFILEFYCIALDVPIAERRWAKAVMEQPHRPEQNKWGLTRKQGQEIIERFIDQNYDEVRDFFADIVNNVSKRVRKNEKRRKSTSGRSK
jgi:hypothetical protein